MGTSNSGNRWSTITFRMGENDNTISVLTHNMQVCANYSQVLCIQPFPKFPIRFINTCMHHAHLSPSFILIVYHSDYTTYWHNCSLCGLYAQIMHIYISSSCVLPIPCCLRSGLEYCNYQEYSPTLSIGEPWNLWGATCSGKGTSMRNWHSPQLERYFGLKIHYHAKIGKFIGIAMPYDELGSLHTLKPGHRTQKASYVLQYLWRCTVSNFDILGSYYTSVETMKAKLILSTLMLCTFTASKLKP